MLDSVDHIKLNTLPCGVELVLSTFCFFIGGPSDDLDFLGGCREETIEQ